jgi:hypothetical protein
MENLRVGEARCIIDADMHEFPAGVADSASVGRVSSAPPALAAIAGHAVARDEDPA